MTAGAHPQSPVHLATSVPLALPPNSVPTCGMDQSSGGTFMISGPQLQPHNQSPVHPDSLLSKGSFPPTGLHPQTQPPGDQNPLPPHSQPSGGSLTVSDLPQTQPSIHHASLVPTCGDSQNTLPSDSHPMDVVGSHEALFLGLSTEEIATIRRQPKFFQPGLSRLCSARRSTDAQIVAGRGEKKGWILAGSMLWESSRIVTFRLNRVSMKTRTGRHSA